jgi:hypothetical protein
MPALPNVTSKFVVDYSDLTKAEKASASAHGQFQSGAKASTTHTLRFTESLTTMMGHIGGMPPLVDTAARSLESMQSNAAQGMSTLQVGVGAAVAGFGILAGVVAESEKKYLELAGSVENYKRVVGGTAEEDGKLVQVFGMVGVSTDTATAAMFKLSKAVETSPAKLEALGVVVSKDAQGNVDLTKTLFSVADAYNATSDQAKKNLIVFDAFGKSGKDMIPILEQGSAGLRALEESARLTFTENDLAQAKKYEIQMNQAKQGWDAFTESIGQKTTPILGALWESFNRGSYVSKRLQEDLDAGRISQEQYRDATYRQTEEGRKLNDVYVAQFDASTKIKGVLDAQTQATNEASAANDALWASTDKLVTQLINQDNAGTALLNAQLALKENDIHLREAQDAQAKSLIAVDTAQDTYNKTVTQYGRNSEQAQAAQLALTKAQDDYTLSTDNVLKVQDANAANYVKVADAARKNQEAIDLATTGQKDAKKEAEAWITTLDKEAQTLDPNSDLYKKLHAYIDELLAVPGTVSTTFQQTYTNSGSRPGGRGLQQFASGGSVAAGVPITVGEKGSEIFTPSTAGTVTPHGGTPPAAGGGPTTLHITLDQPIILDGREIGHITDERVASLLAGAA